ncbi:MAG TPA: DnaJ domain-containing protein [Bacteroidales bacterium]|nr:DnaJ domain-containing protein [Bacteroidales bacterium]HPF03768.1 DnaJ domain-containing protein [Bacteroidales bacterium]HPJ59498.1 DnaJ domain-containing protein [Bacteroidales bacterium]HPR12881.1 DnaJ domain-containing protein [Bacteroidales bacterium]HRW85092.1 DnaJ domain-containing protein [Bacteroidales bacterium]
MTISEYYRILGINSGASVDQIKKAYRCKARMYHPDINKLPGAMEKFILVTEAYEFLITNHEKLNNDEASFREAMDEWQKYRQEKSRRRANAYARSSYARFRKSKFYRATRILDLTSILISLIISVVVIVYTIIGYIYRLRHPLPEIENPSVMVFLMLLSIGIIFFAISMVYLKAYIENSRKNKKKAI